jgi:uncharacterized protein (DUF427 family)
MPTYYLPREDIRPGALVDETAGHVTFSWQQLEWHEEDERVLLVHAKDPYKRADTLRSSRRVQMFAGGHQVADSIRPLLLFETGLPTRYYLAVRGCAHGPARSQRHGHGLPLQGPGPLLVPARRGRLRAGCAWSYPDPIPENPKIRGLICFFNEQVDLVVAGVRLERPVTEWSVPGAGTLDG